MMRKGPTAVLITFLVCLTAASGRAEEVLVFAASSLSSALDEAGEGFAARTGHRMAVSYAGSAALARQIEQGAPAHLFASADVLWMDYLGNKGLLVPGSRADLLGNALVLVAPAGGGRENRRVDPGKDVSVLAKTGRIAVGDPAGVPAGRYFRQAMERSGQWAEVEPGLARAPSVRAALALVERGEAPWGAVFETDARASGKVEVVGVFPEALHDPIIYSFSLLAGHRTPAAQALLDHLGSPEARAVFVRHGFTVR